MHFAVPAELRQEYAFIPGQHLTLRRRSGTARRAGGAPDLLDLLDAAGARRAGVLRIGVKRIANGLFSGWLTGELQPGTTIEVMTPAGRFGTPVAPGNARHVGCLAAGSGITPVLSIVTSVLRTEPASRVTLVYGNRTSNDVMFLEELADLKNSYPSRFTLLHVLSAEPQLSDLLTGRIDEDKIELLLDGLCKDVDEWYLCGPLGMVTTARAALQAGGVPGSAVHAELFYVGDEPPVPATAALEHAATDRSQVTVTLSGPDLDDRGRLHRPEHPRRGAGQPAGRAVRLQGRRVRHLPGDGDRRLGHR